MVSSARDLSRHLAARAEAVCAEYLSNGRREGRYWRVGDLDNSPGRSLYVRLCGQERGQGAVGKWTDAATGQHGDLLDLIQHVRHFSRLGAAMAEARAFLKQVRPQTDPYQWKPPFDRLQAAGRLFAMARPLARTLGATYLARRGIETTADLVALRFHATCPYRADDKSRRESWPALVAAVTDVDGTTTGILRTWLARDGSGKAPLATPRRAMGSVLGHAVRVGDAIDVMAAGEGLETVLSIRQALPAMPVAAALSAGSLGALILPTTLPRLYVVCDNDAAGRRGADRLRTRAVASGTHVTVLVPQNDDFNTDLCTLGLAAMRVTLREQLQPQDRD